MSENLYLYTVYRILYVYVQATSNYINILYATIQEHNMIMFCCDLSTSDTGLLLMHRISLFSCLKKAPTCRIFLAKDDALQPPPA